jgi:hypothetical protein
MRKRIYQWLAGGAFITAIFCNMIASVWAIGSLAQAPPAVPTVRQMDGADRALLQDVLAYINTPEYLARDAARDQRLRAIELQLAAAHRQEAREARYEKSRQEGIVLDATAGTPIYAMGTAGDRVTVACSTSEFGQTAVVSTSAFPDRFFKAKYLQACEPGQYKPGAEIGLTVGELIWSEHSQSTGTASEPSRTPVEMAVTGYRPGQYAAPFPDGEAVDLKAIAQGVKNIFSGQN